MRTKTLEKFVEEKDKNPLDWIGWSEKERKSLKSFWNSEEHVREKLFKRLNFWISISRNGVQSIKKYIRLIEHQSNQADSNQIFKRIFDQLKNTFDRSKIWKIEIFEKQRMFYTETTQTNLFHEWNVWLWVKIFFKNIWIQLRSSKNKIFTLFVPKTQSINMFCIKIKEHIIFV